MANSDIGAYHYAASSNTFEIQRGNNFDIAIDMSLDNIKAFGSDTFTLTKGPEMIRLAVSSASVPHFSQAPIQVKRGNTTVKYAGPIEFPSGRLTCYDFIRDGSNSGAGAYGTKDVLMAWQALSGDPKKQTVGLQKDYKKTCTLLEYSPDYSILVRTWKLVGCWISSLEEEEYSQEANGARRITVNIEYDYAYPDYEA